MMRAALALLLCTGCMVVREPLEQEEATGWCMELCTDQELTCGHPAEKCLDFWDAQSASWFRCNDLLDYPLNCEDPTQPGSL